MPVSSAAPPLGRGALVETETAPVATLSDVVPAAGKYPGKHFTATLEGKPIALRTALAASYGGRALEVMFSTHPMSCRVFEQSDSMMRFEQSEQRFGFVLSPQLKPDGSTAWSFYTESYFASESGFGHGTVVEERRTPQTVQAFDAHSDVRATVQFDMRGPSKTSERLPLHIQGSFVAHGCGVIPRRSRPRPQTQLSLEIAGTRLPIISALLEPAERTITLSTTAIDCSTPHLFDQWADAQLEIPIDESSDRSAMLRGALFVTQRGAPFPNGSVKLGSRQGDVQKASINASYMHLKYKLVISGNIEAVVCSP
jgi:hypothetical protein